MSLETECLSMYSLTIKVEWVRLREWVRVREWVREKEWVRENKERMREIRGERVTERESERESEREKER